MPAKCAELLHEGRVDLGLIPAIEYLRGDYAIVPDISIASDGDVATVAVFTRKPIERVETLALDLSSRTSVALTRVLCAKQWEHRAEVHARRARPRRDAAGAPMRRWSSAIPPSRSIRRSTT